MALKLRKSERLWACGLKGCIQIRAAKEQPKVTYSEAEKPLTRTIRHPSQHAIDEATGKWRVVKRAYWTTEEIPFKLIQHTYSGGRVLGFVSWRDGYRFMRSLPRDGNVTEIGAAQIPVLLTFLGENHATAA